MSRTYKTAPYWVQLNNPERTKIEVHEYHDHSRGECDLPETPMDQHHSDKRTRCSWDWESNGRNPFCGCDLCTGQSWRKLEAKAKRRKSNERRRNFATDVEFFYDEFDDYDDMRYIYW